MMSVVPASPEQYPTRKLPILSTKLLKLSRKTARTGRVVQFQTNRVYPSRLSSVFGRLWASSRIARKTSSFRPIRSSLKKCTTSLGFISIRPTTRWCCASMRRARHKPSNEANRCYPWVWAMSKVSRTTTKGMVRQRSSRHWMFRQAKCSASVADGIDTRSSFGF